MCDRSKMRGITFTLRISYAMKWKDDDSDRTHHHLMYCNSLSIICFVFRSPPLALCCCVFLSVLCYNHKRSVQHAAGLLDNINLSAFLWGRKNSFLNAFGSAFLPSFSFLWPNQQRGVHACKMLVRMKVKEHWSQEQFPCLSFKSVRSNKGH